MKIIDYIQLSIQSSNQLNNNLCPVLPTLSTISNGEIQFHYFLALAFIFTMILKHELFSTEFVSDMMLALTTLISGSIRLTSSIVSAGANEDLPRCCKKSSWPKITSKALWPLHRTLCLVGPKFNI